MPSAARRRPNGHPRSDVAPGSRKSDTYLVSPTTERLAEIDAELSNLGKSEEDIADVVARHASAARDTLDDVDAALAALSAESRPNRGDRSARRDSERAPTFEIGETALRESLAVAAIGAQAAGSPRESSSAPAAGTAFKSRPPPAKTARASKRATTAAKASPAAIPPMQSSADPEPATRRDGAGERAASQRGNGAPGRLPHGAMFDAPQAVSGGAETFDAGDVDIDVEANLPVAAQEEEPTRGEAGEFSAAASASGSAPLSAEDLFGDADFDDAFGPAGDSSLDISEFLDAEGSNDAVLIVADDDEDGGEQVLLGGAASDRGDAAAIIGASPPRPPGIADDFDDADEPATMVMDPSQLLAEHPPPLGDPNAWDAFEAAQVPPIAAIDDLATGSMERDDPTTQSVPPDPYDDGLPPIIPDDSPPSAEEVDVDLDILLADEVGTSDFAEPLGPEYRLLGDSEEIVVGNAELAAEPAGDEGAEGGDAGGEDDEAGKAGFFGRIFGGRKPKP